MRRDGPAPAKASELIVLNPETAHCLLLWLTSESSIVLHMANISQYRYQCYVINAFELKESKMDRAC